MIARLQSRNAIIEEDGKGKQSPRGSQEAEGRSQQQESTLPVHTQGDPSLPTRPRNNTRM